MRGTRARALAVVAVLGLGAVAACVDLFHSTGFETICGVHPDTKGCDAGEAGRADASKDAKRPADAGPIDFCGLDSARARSMAEHACAWLGACTVPFDQNAFGQCMIDAILAFDCHANPSFPIAEGPLHDYWQALAGASSCAEVLSVVNPKGIACSGTGYTCAASLEPGLLLECKDNTGGPETCLVEGRVCVGSGACGTQGADGGACEGGTSCSGDVLHDCEGTSDLGRDCEYFGAGACATIGEELGAQCAPSNDGGAPCTPTNQVTCGDAGEAGVDAGDGAVATGNTAAACPNGFPVTIDCQTLTGPGTCVPGTPTPIWNVAAQCQAADAGCEPGCGGSDTLTGCAQGATFTTSCMAQGLRACRSVVLVSTTGYACAPP